MFSAFRTQATITGSGVDHSVATPTEGTDTLSSIEAIKFEDGRLVYDVTDPAAVVLRVYDAAFDRAPTRRHRPWPTGLRRSTPKSASPPWRPPSRDRRDSSPNTAPSTTSNSSRPSTRTCWTGRNFAGVTYWTQQLDSGAATRGQVLAGFSEAKSPEHVQQSRAQIEAGYWEQDPVVSSVARLYDAAFNHRPDPTGLTYWDNAAMGQSLNAVAAGFVASSEFSAAYGSLNNQQFVQQIYQNVVDRPGDAAGVSYWTGELDHGASRADVLLAFSEAPEHKALTSSWIDQGILFA